METSLKSVEKTNLEQEIKLIDGIFTPSEARSILNGVLDTKINFHKVQRLSRTEGDSNDTCKYDNGRIIELLDAKQDTKTFLTDPRLKGKKLKIESHITIQVLD